MSETYSTVDKENLSNVNIKELNTTGEQKCNV